MKNYQCTTCGLCSSSLKLARDHKWCANHGKFVIRTVDEIAKDCLETINKIPNIDSVAQENKT